MKRKGKQHQISEEKIKNIWKQKEKAATTGSNRQWKVHFE